MIRFSIVAGAPFVAGLLIGSLAYGTFPELPPAIPGAALFVLGGLWGYSVGALS